MTRFNFQVSFTMVSVFAVTFLAGCSSQTETTADKNSNVARPANNSAPSGNVAPSVVPANSSPMPGNVAANRSSNAQPPANIPQTKIGSGGNDLSLLASARAALSTDKNLINSVVVEVKEGSVTLSGKVSSEEQKNKAEELVRGVQGVKNIKNNLRVAP